MTRTHTILSTGRSQARTICFLSENVHPSKVFSTSTGVNPSFSSQEPRRPRFSFFYLHNVKELTIPPSPASIVIESIALKIPSENMTLCAGYPAGHPALSETAKQWEEQVLNVVSVGFTQQRFRCQHPIFVFRFDPKLENLKSKLLLFSEACCIPWRRLASRSAAVRRVLRVIPLGVNTVGREKRRICHFGSMGNVDIATESSGGLRL
ncbi:MAG: hypothetical protein P0Y65_00005 [Candidatus Devosia phytovorans]|uniref:Uncharacterized protein n=1 Tax=Candidatus Devosia phytovorans TaxID=3121372 RepID=A0AAJ5VWI4_9HYPH|nr:hypothetical protein [Devosia sp.]WEK04684.1 MAG: hypothetical protein P0Y65_00005 [Devosia sp.]